MSKEVPYIHPQALDEEKTIGTIVGREARKAASMLSDEEREESKRKALARIYNRGKKAEQHANSGR